MKQIQLTQFWIWGIVAVAISGMPTGIVVSAGVMTDCSDPQSKMQSNHELQKIMGTVKKTKKVGTEERDQENLVAQLKTQDGETMLILDLGAVEKFQDIDIKVGKRITVWGQSINIGDKRVVAVHRLQTTDGTINLKCRPMPSQQQASGYQF